MKKSIKLASALGVIIILILINGLIKRWDGRIDMTADKRYTLSNMTEDFVKNTPDDWQIELFLDGSLNAGFMKLEKATLNMLNRFQHLNAKSFHISHIKIDDLDKKEKARYLKILKDMDLSPINIVDEDVNGKRTQKQIYPWAIIHHNGQERAIKLLVNVRGKSGEQNLTSSVENMEYLFMETFRLMTEKENRRVAFLEGHGELNEGETYDMTSALSQFYSVDRGRIGDDLTILDPYDVVIVARPMEVFSEKDKFVLDQYLMNGGKVLWLIDGVKMSMDSFTKAEKNYGIYNDVNLSDMLFRYGVRINPDLIVDLQCALYPVNVAVAGEDPKFQSLPWFFAPLLQVNEQNAISRNISNVKAEFVSTLDLVGDNENTKKIILMNTSSHTKVMPVPVEIDLAHSAENFDAQNYNSGIHPVAVLLEGQFNSVFSHRSVPKELHFNNKVKKEIGTTKMIVISDGDIIKNDLRGQGEQTQVLPLGYDMASGQVIFGNKDFLLNAVNYLADNDGWYQLRERRITLRLLDKKEIDRRQYYRILNIGLPLIIILLLSLGFLWIRKYKYARKSR